MRQDDNAVARLVAEKLSGREIDKPDPNSPKEWYAVTCINCWHAWAHIYGGWTAQIGGGEECLSTDCDCRDYQPVVVAKRA